MTTDTRKSLIMWDDPRAVEYIAYGWITPTGYVWKSHPITPNKLRDTYDIVVKIRASKAYLDNDTKQALNAEFGW